MDYNLEEKIVVITGGVQGIGFSISSVFLKNKIKTVILLDVNEDLGITAADDLILKFGENKAVFMKCDITNDLDEIFNRIIGRHKTIDILVNCAGVTDEFNVQKSFDINTVALINWSYKFYEHMRRDKGGNGGTIINIASALGLEVTQFMSVYTATKFAAVAFSKSLGHEYNYLKTGVRVVVMCPGATDTSFYKKMLDRDEIKQRDWEKLHEDLPIQNSNAVAEATAEVYRIAESGTAWLINGSTPLTKVL